MTAKYLLGIDDGCTMAKAALFTADGRELAVASHKVEAVSPQPGWMEVDMDALWRATARAVRLVLQQSGVDPAEVACVACTGHGNGLYLIDADGRPVRNAIGSADARARQYVEQWTADDVLERIHGKTMQSIWPGQPNALLRWLLDHEPQVVEQARWILMCKDFIRYRLTGQVHMELTDASGTSLIDVGRAAHDDEVLAAWGLQAMRDKLPPLCASADRCGEVTAAAAKATGLAAGTPVAGGMFDIDACGLASGMVDHRVLCMVGGTWGNNQYIAREPVVSSDVFMTSCYSIPGYYLMLEGSATSASNLEWFVTQFFDADRQLLAETEKSVYALCDELVAATKPDEAGVVFLPFLYGSNVSLDGKACLFGLDGWQSRGHALRAVFEGVVFAHFWHVERLLNFRDKPEHIRLTGGASRSEVWAQIFADIFEVPVEIPDGTELGALGAAMCAAVSVGVHGSFEAAADAMVRIARTHRPNARWADVYRRKYARYKRLLEAMAPVWAELAWPSS